MNLSFLLLVCSLLSYGNTQKTDDIDTIYYPVDPNVNVTAHVNLPTEECECLPYHLCNSSIKDARSNDGCDSLSICCRKTDQKDPHSPLSTHSAKCGVDNPEYAGPRIPLEDDEVPEALFGEFPWMIAVMEINSSENTLVYRCGASLIHPQVVLTSVDCINEKDKELLIRAGEWDTQTTAELYSHQDRHVKKIIIHPEYYTGALVNNIALLILESPVKIEYHIDTVCLPMQNQLVENTPCFVTSWGRNETVLKKIELPIVERSVCQESLRTTGLGKLHDSLICIGGEPNRNSYRGDKGSPLVCRIPGHPDRFFQAGIASRGLSCCETEVPGVYVNVALFSNWINKEFTDHNLEKSYYTY